MDNVGRLWMIFGTLGGIMLALALLWVAVGESRLAWGSAATGAGFLVNAAFAAKRAGTGADMHRQPLTPDSPSAGRDRA